MKILTVPNIYQPSYKSSYPEYSCGKNIEEIFHEYFKNEKDNICTDYIYIPIYWTSLYVLRNYAANINDIYTWINNLDNTKKYFTIIQYAAGIFVNKHFNIDIKVFSAGGGGINFKNECITTLRFNNFTRDIFTGNIGNYIIPLLCKPYFNELNINKNIYCSFMGRFDTHPCRIKMKNCLQDTDRFKFFNSVNYEEYNKIINESIFTLAPRGYGYTSFRLYEAILGNSIPIYIWSDKLVLPFNDIINWNNYCIIINENDIDKLPDILENVNIELYQNNIKNLKKYINFDFTYKYIKEKLLINFNG